MLRALRCLAVLPIAASIVNAATVTVRSGNGSIGGTDAYVRFLIGPSFGPFGHVFTAADFASAQTGPPAFILAPNPLWISGLSEDPFAQWIGTNSDAGCCQGNTALYAVSFQISSPFEAATLELNYASDDAFGDTVGGGPNTGVYLNGIPICGSVFVIGFSQANSISCGSVGSSLLVGTNWLFIENLNVVASAGLLFSATITTTNTPPGPSINPGGVVSAASYAAPVAPGSIAAVYGNFLLGSPSVALSIPLATTLSGLAMEFGSAGSAPLFYVSGEQVNLQIPWELAAPSESQLTASIGGQTSAPQAVNLAPFSPGIFSMNGQGTGQGAILDSSYYLVDASNPATAGKSVIQIYCTGLGAVTNQPPSGSPAPFSPLAETAMPTTVTIGSVPAQVLFSGLTPGLVGLYQVNAEVPAGAPSGLAVPVTISIGGTTSNAVTIAVESAAGPNPLPAISGLSPSSAIAGSSGPLTVTINGGGFIAPSSVTFNGVVHRAAFLNSGALTISLAPSDLAVAGSFPVVVTNAPPGGGASNAVNFIVTAAQATVPGTLQGTWLSTPTGASGSFGASLTQAGSEVSGEVLLTGSSCFSIGTVAGTVGESFSSLSLLASFNTGAQVQFLGTGAYSVLSGSCAGDFGTFSLTALTGQVSITGAWQGSFLSITGLSGSLSANIAQNMSVLTATISLTGSPCFTNGTASGNIIAETISLGSAFSGGQQAQFDGTVSSSGNSIAGQYNVLNGACAGDYGTFVLTKQ